MNRNPEVDAWFDAYDHPLAQTMARVREIFLAADPRLEESIKWKAPTFSYKGNLMSFQPRAKRFVSLMFHRGAEIPGEHPLLLGDGALVRTMQIADLAEAEAHADAIAAVVRAWCDSR